MKWWKLCNVLFWLWGGYVNAQPPSTPINAIRFGGQDDQIRIVLDSQYPLSYHHFTLIDGGMRFVIDIDSANWALNASHISTGSGDGHNFIPQFRYAVRKNNIARLVLDLEKPAILRRSFGLDPTDTVKHHRTVFDLEVVSAQIFSDENLRLKQTYLDAVNALESVTPSNNSASYPSQKGVDPSPSTLAHLTSKPVIVIDPGHGGHDPGARGVAGTLEKDVNLLTARILKTLLNETDRYEVYLTRTDDSFIRLQDRVQIARDKGANLFISLHADAAGSRTVRGASVYTLSEKGEARIDKVRHQEEWILPVETESRREEVTEILVDLLKRETKNRSAEFAQMLIPELKKAGPLLRNTHRSAGFVVLLAPDVPAVLVETGFLTNRQDEKRLASAQGRVASAKAIQRAIDKYFDRQRALYASR